MSDYDTPWKLILEKYFQFLLEFLLPHIARDIDWAKPFMHLDKELLAIQKKSHVGKKIADKLVQVFKNNGEKIWIIIHLEIQGTYEKQFARRLFEYYYRIYDRYKMPVTTVAILTDNRNHWRPCEYSQEIWGCSLIFKFPIIKLIDFISKKEILSRSKNPIAKVIEAHLAALASRNNATLQFENKLKLIKDLYFLGYTGEDIRVLYSFIDYAISLPANLEHDLMTKIRQYEDGIKMSYISNAERIGMECGIQQGIQQGVQQIFLLALKKRFASKISQHAAERIQKATSQELEQWLEKIFDGTFELTELE